jgi:hypothetical protein
MSSRAFTVGTLSDCSLATSNAISSMRRPCVCGSRSAGKMLKSGATSEPCPVRVSMSTAGV